MSLKLQDKVKSMSAGASLKNVPLHIMQPPYAINGIVPPSPLRADIKSESEIQRMREACQVARQVLNTARDFVKVHTLYIIWKY